MERREFVGLTAGLVAGGTLIGCGRQANRNGAVRGGGPLTAERYRAERRLVDIPQGRIAYVERGRGSAALFLHGFPLNGFQWRGALERLSDRRRCIAPDFLGLGYTEVATGQGVDPLAQVAMLIAFLDRLGIPAVDLVASDSGGAVAQLLVTRHPDRVRTLLLTNCDAEIDSPPPAVLPVIEQAKAGRFVPDQLAPQLTDPATARQAGGIGPLCYADPNHPTDEAVEYYFAPLVAKPDPAHAYAIALAPNPLAGIRSALRRCRIPTRIVWGTADIIFSPDSPGYLDHAFGNSLGVRRLEGRMLFFPEEVPNIVAEEARGLWASG